ncbi:hypothetical protein PGT21_033068 [Puccinia graminis f. sp. tritici]|uniref:Uncharacterized protein n=1 Tax=Puccinia graminis f. sp. tritici TaxID=56615 RepID=A0A5B0QCK9_PUCGR|nr:hypothetical protein PGT21_033068 [Puccinia graminis f. sp. tritici]
MHAQFAKIYQMTLLACLMQLIAQSSAFDCTDTEACLVKSRDGKSFKFFLPRLVSKTATCTKAGSTASCCPGKDIPTKTFTTLEEAQKACPAAGGAGGTTTAAPGSTGGTTKAGTAGGTNTRPGTTGSTEKAAEKDKTKTETPKAP